MDDHEIPSTTMNASTVSSPKGNIESKKDASVHTNTTSKRDSGCPYCEVPGLRRRSDFARNCSSSCYDSTSEDLDRIDLHPEHSDSEHMDTSIRKRKKRCHPDLSKSIPKIKPPLKRRKSENDKKKELK